MVCMTLQIFYITIRFSFPRFSLHFTTTITIILQTSIITIFILICFIPSFLANDRDSDDLAFIITLLTSSQNDEAILRLPSKDISKPTSDIVMPLQLIKSLQMVPQQF